MTCDLQAIRKRAMGAGVSVDDALALLAEVDRLHTWDGLMSLLDEHYPLDVWVGTSHDPGARIIALTRALDRLRAVMRTASVMVDGWHDDTRDYLNAALEGDDG